MQISRQAGAVSSAESKWCDAVTTELERKSMGSRVGKSLVIKLQQFLLGGSLPLEAFFFLFESGGFSFLFCGIINSFWLLLKCLVRTELGPQYLSEP